MPTRSYVPVVLRWGNRSQQRSNPPVSHFLIERAQKKPALLDATRKLGIVSAEYGDPVVFARPTARQQAQHGWKENTVMVEPNSPGSDSAAIKSAMGICFAIV